jgi:hypothetical protein
MISAHRGLLSNRETAVGCHVGWLLLENIAHHSCSVAPNFCAQWELFARAHFLVHSIINSDISWSTTMLTGLGILAVLIFIAFSAVRASQRWSPHLIVSKRPFADWVNRRKWNGLGGVMRILTLLVIVCVGLLLSPQANRAAYVYTQVGSGWIEEDVETQTLGAVADLIRANENARMAPTAELLFDFASSGPDAQSICFNAAQGSCPRNPEDGSISVLPP